MRFVICCISLITTCVVMSGCGQSGALQLPSDENHDKRAKYLLYSDAKQEAEHHKHDADQAASDVKSN